MIIKDDRLYSKPLNLLVVYDNENDFVFLNGILN